MVHQIYVDNGSLTNILYEHYRAWLPEDSKAFIKPATSCVVGFVGRLVWLEGKISLPLTLTDYENGLKNIILVGFLIIKFL